MKSPLYNAFGGQTPSNMNNLLRNFKQFRNTFTGNPRQQVQNLLNSGRMSQAQFNQLKQMADEIQKFL